MDVNAAAALIDSTLDKIVEMEEDYPHVYSKASDFFVSISEKLESMALTIEQSSAVSDRQATAIENMAEGVNKWHRNCG
jgi:hypothetical protein